MNNMMPPLQANADDLARYGRYGDSMLVHMNPAEVQGIAALSPTGKLTTNPVTGQPEAFLPFLAPLLSQFIPAALSSVGLSGLGAAAAAAPGITSALTSGLITGVVEGDLEKGIMAGITSFGMGKALGAASDAVGAKDQIAELATANTDVADASKAIADAAAMTQPVETLTPQLERAGALTNAAVGRPDIGRMQQALSSAEARRGVAQTSLDAARQDMTGMDRIGSVFTEDGAKAGLEAFMKPEAILPTAIGAGNLAQMEAMEQMQAVGKAQEAKRMRRREMDRGVLSGAAQVAQPNNPFAGVFNKPGLSAFNS